MMDYVCRSVSTWIQPVNTSDTGNFRPSDVETCASSGVFASKYGTKIQEAHLSSYCWQEAMVHGLGNY